MSTPSELPPGQADRLATLLDALGPIPISDAERASLTWLAGFEAHTVENIAHLIFRARERSAVVAVRRLSYETVGLRLEAERLRGRVADARNAAISQGLAADRCRRQLVDLCEQAGIDLGDDLYAALLAHLRGRAER